MEVLQKTLKKSKFLLEKRLEMLFGVEFVVGQIVVIIEFNKRLFLFGKVQGFLLKLGQDSYIQSLIHQEGLS